MRAMRPSPTASRMDRATVVFPEPVPPATPSRQGVLRGDARRGSSSGAVSIIARLRSRGSRNRGDCTLPGLTLTAGAEVGAPPPLHDAADRRAAGEAGLPFPVVDRERHLEVAGVPLAVGEVIEGGPALMDGLGEDG